MQRGTSLWPTVDDHENNDHDDADHDNDDTYDTDDHDGGNCCSKLKPHGKHSHKFRKLNQTFTNLIKLAHMTEEDADLRSDSKVSCEAAHHLYHL